MRDTPSIIRQQTATNEYIGAMNGVYKSYTNILFVDFARESKECQTERLASSLHLVCSVLMVELPTRQ
jgi:hypothetical protein